MRLGRPGISMRQDELGGKRGKGAAKGKGDTIKCATLYSLPSSPILGISSASISPQLCVITGKKLPSIKLTQVFKSYDMKSQYLLATQWIFTILIMLIGGNGYSQRPITWKGGTPGMKNDWFCPQNWSSASVPDEFSDVIIPDVSTSTFASPVIRSGKVEINSLEIHASALLTIDKTASVVVISHVAGLVPGRLKGEGRLILEDQSTQCITKLVADQSH